MYPRIPFAPPGPGPSVVPEADPLRAWDTASLVERMAWEAWKAAPRELRALAGAAFVAALDQEEAAARALERRGR
jgi:hypothetical protein